MKRTGQPFATPAIALLAIGIVGAGPTGAADNASYPWDGAGRSAWVAEAARRVFTLEGPPDMATLSEVCASACPESAYVRPEPTSAEREVHAIGVYEGPSEQKAEIQSSEAAGPIDLRIRPTEKPVVLVLMSYDPVVWRIHLDDGARLHQVRYDGHGRVELPSGGSPVQRVEGLPSIYSIFPSYDDPGDGPAEKTLRSLERSAGYSVDSFQGAYRGSTFEVPFFRDSSPVREVGLKVRELQSAKMVTTKSSFDLVVGKAVVRFNDPDVPGGQRKLVTFDRREEVRGAVEVESKFYAITESAFFVHDTKTGTALSDRLKTGQL